MANWRRWRTLGRDNTTPCTVNGLSHGIYTDLAVVSSCIDILVGSNFTWDIRNKFVTRNFINWCMAKFHRRLWKIIMCATGENGPRVIQATGLARGEWGGTSVWWHWVAGVAQPKCRWHTESVMSLASITTVFSYTVKIYNKIVFRTSIHLPSVSECVQYILTLFSDTHFLYCIFSHSWLFMFRCLNYMETLL